MNRKLICWACGRELLAGKFLHCTACGMNFGEECWQSLLASIAAEGSLRPTMDQTQGRRLSIEEFPPWLFLGNMAGKHIFVQYLLEMLQVYQKRKPEARPRVLFQCNSCLVDVSYVVADAGMFTKLASARQQQKTELILSGKDVDDIQHVVYMDGLPAAVKGAYHQLVKAGLLDQLKSINMVAGVAWQVDLTDKTPDAYRFGVIAPATRIYLEKF